MAQNEIQTLYEGSQSVQIAAVGGSLTVTLDGNTSGTINWNDPTATIQTTMEGVTGIGSGNIAVTETLDDSSNRIGLVFTFQGALADTPIDLMTVDSALLQAANTITVTETQSGSPDTRVTPTLTITQSAMPPVAAVDGVSTFNVGAASMGTYEVAPGSGALIDIFTLLNGGGASYLQSVLNTYTGGGIDNVTDLGGATYSIRVFYPVNNAGWTGGTNSTDGAPSFSLVNGPSAAVDGVYEQYSLTFSSVPTTGTCNMSFASGVEFSSSDTASSFQTNIRNVTPISSASVTGDTTSGFTIVADDSGAYTAYLATVTGNTLAVAGTPQIISVANADYPTQGNDIFTINGTATTQAYNVSWSTLTSATGWAVTGSGTSGDPWIFTAPSNASDVSFTVSEDTTTPALLMRYLAAVIVETQAGGVTTTTTTTTTTTLAPTTTTTTTISSTTTSSTTTTSAPVAKAKHSHQLLVGAG